MNVVTTRLAKTFDDPAVRPELWSALLRQGDTDVSTLTWQAQRLWWQENGRTGGLLLVVAECAGEPRAIAPLFVEGGMAMNLCAANYLDFIGDVSDPETMDAILQAARGHVSPFVGFRIYFVPHTSRTGKLLQEAAVRLGLDCVLEDEQISPIIDIRGKPEAARDCTRKKTVLRRENSLRRDGTLDVYHYSDAKYVLPQLELFYEQHIARWSGTPTPSRFRDARHRESFRARTRELADAGWLRFSRLDWNGRPIAFHRGTCYRGHFKYGRCTYDPDMARYSPGTVLLRHVLMQAIEERAHTFDFGMGAEEYKYRYATDEVRLQTWGLYTHDSQ